MATTITMPQLGETVTEGTVAQWLKSVGDSVDKYEDFVEVSTDKVNAGVPSPVTGTIRELLVKEGETVATGTPIAVIEEVGAASASTASATPAAAAPAAPSVATDRPQSGPSSNGSPSPAAVDGAEAEAALRGASPAVRRLAREHRIDIRAIKGSGTNGRVTAGDVLAATRPGAPTGSTPAAATPLAPTTPAAPDATRTSTYAQPVPGTTVTLTQARRIIAERMVESRHTAPHAWSMVEIDVTDVWKWRAREKERFERETGYKLTLLPFFVRAVVQALATFPLMNARFAPASSSSQAAIYVNDEVNVGIAIGLPTN